MATAARLALAAWRNELCTRTIRIVGMDLTAAAAAGTLRAQIRSYANQPGDPKIDLATVAAGDEGISFGGVTTDDSGATVSTLTLQIDKTTMSDAAALPYSGEAGDDNRLVWQLQIDGVTRVYGDFIALASAIDSDSAPTDYLVASSVVRSCSRPWSISTLTFSDDTVTVKIDGADALAPLVQQAQAAVDSVSGLAGDIAASKRVTDRIDPFGGLVDDEDTPWPAGQPILAVAHGQRIMPVIGSDRRLIAYGLDLRNSETAAPDAEDTGDITAVREVDSVTGKVVGAYNPDGTRWFVPDAQTLQYIAEQIGSGGSAIAWRGGGATDIAGSTSLWRATMSDDLGWTGRVKQLPGGGYSTAVADVLPLVALHYYGQSNAGRGGSAVSVLTNADLPHHVLAFDAGQAQYGTDAFDPATATDFVAAADTAGLAPHPAIASGFASALLDRRFGTIDRAYLTRTDWYGGEPLTTFVKGEQTYDNLIGSITKASEIATSYGLFYRPVVVFVQGESGPSDRASYGAMFDGLIDDLRTDIAAITRKTPPLIFFQINTGDNVTGAFAKPIKLAQLDVAKARAGTDVVLAGPMYQCPFAETPVNEVIHPGAPGRAIYGEVASLVERIIAREGTFNPLMIAAVTRTGATIVVDFELPPGARSIAVDDDWIGAAVTTPNLGFSYVDSGGAITIDSAEISGPAQVTITLSADPTGNSDITLRYAIDEADTTDDNWSDARGLIYASSGIASTLAELPELAGQIPADIRHYCVADEVTLS